MELVKARAIAEEVKSLLALACHRIEIVGDIRRQKPQVGHIELLVIPKPEISDGEPIPPQYRDLIDFLSDPMPDASLESLPADRLEEEIMELMFRGVLGSHPSKMRNYAYEPKYKLMLLHDPSGIGVHIFSTTPECWPVALAVRTSGKETNKRITSAARRKGWRFRVKGDGFDTPDGHITCSTEREVFEAVGLPYLPPEQRE